MLKSSSMNMLDCLRFENLSETESLNFCGVWKLAQSNPEFAYYSLSSHHSNW